MKKYSGWVAVFAVVGWAGAAMAQNQAEQRTMTPLTVQPHRVIQTAPSTSSTLPAHPGPVQGATMRPLTVQPRRVQTVPASAPARTPYPPPRAPAPVQAAPVQPVYQPVARPAPVQPVYQPAPVQPVYQPVLVPVQPAPVQPVYQPVPVQPVVQPVVQPAPVQPVVQLAPVQPVYQPVYQEPAPAPVYTPPPPTPLTLTAEPEEDYGYGEDWGTTVGSGSDWPGLALGVKFGSTGLGGELTFGFNRFFNLRGGLSYAPFSYSMDLDGVDYDTDFSMMTIPLLLDLYPMGGNFRITGGIHILPGTMADITSTPGSPVQIGRHTYGPDVVGTLTGEIEVANMIAPYVGIGFGNAVGEDQALSFGVDLGVAFQSYDLTLSSDGAGMTAVQPNFREDMALEEQNIEEDLDSFKVFPVLTLNMTYHF